MRNWFAVTPVAALLVGCGTIDQVPLVYASTVKVGLSAEGGTPQVPGAKVVIGVESTDVAMVPIAIGRTCRGPAPDACEATRFPIDRVTGSNDISPAAFLQLAQAKADAVRTASAEIERLQGALNVAASAKATAQAQRDQLAADRARLAALKERRRSDTELATTQAATVATAAGTTAAVVAPVTTYDQQIADLTGAVANADAVGATFAATSTALDQATTALKVAYDEFDQRQQQLADALSKHPDAIGDRHDALSVFGSFDADASAKAAAETGGGVKLGKSFSTGIAAQLLTEGLKQAASSTAASNCLKQAMAIGATYPATVGDAVKACAGHAD